MFIAEWNEDGKYNYKVFENENEAIEFSCDAYLDCLVSVSVKPAKEVIARWFQERKQAYINEDYKTYDRVDNRIGKVYNSMT